ncbi:MAG: hypothetical protein QOI55_2342, partial [Actinomycetota bacterium]|nr:hypothetical protein [Actinomycetota bacterium]
VAVLAGGFLLVQPAGSAAVVVVDVAAALGFFLSLPPSTANNATTIANNATKMPTRTAVLRWR